MAHERAGSHRKASRWWLELQKFQIEIDYKPGKKNQNADCLSRTPIFEVPSVAKEHTVCLIIEEWKTAQERDDNIKKMRIRESTGAEGEGRGDEMLERDTASTDTRQYERYVRLPSGLMATPEGKILVPLDRRKEILERFHNHRLAGHLGKAKTLFIRRRLHWKSINKDVAQYVKNCLDCANGNSMEKLLRRSIQFQ
jgi:hypothetical protein